jgi:hypothetical protein
LARRRRCGRGGGLRRCRGLHCGCCVGRSVPKPIYRPLLLLPRPPIAAVVRGVSRPVPAQAASVVSIPTQAPGWGRWCSGPSRLTRFFLSCRTALLV